MTSFGESFSVDTISVSKQFNVEGVVSGGATGTLPAGGSEGDVWFRWGSATAEQNGVYVYAAGTWTQCSQNN